MKSLVSRERAQTEDAGLSILVTGGDAFAVIFDSAKKEGFMRNEGLLTTKDALVSTEMSFLPRSEKDGQDSILNSLVSQFFLCNSRTMVRDNVDDEDISS